MKQVAPDTKICAYCGQIIVRRPNDHPSQWKPRKYCNQKCSQAGHKKDGIWRNYRND